MEALEALRVGQALLYTILALAAVRVWLRDRGRPAAYLALAFIALATATSLGRALDRVGIDELVWLLDLPGVLVLAFPWLLAAFAWSFEGPLPRWLAVGGFVQIALAATFVVLPPLGEIGTRTDVATGFLVATLIMWLLLVGAAARRLWNADPRHRVVRVRTRSMAVGGFILGGVLAASASVPQTGITAFTTVFVTLIAGVLFGVGFAPPRALRLWWLQPPAGAVSRLQLALIAASTPREIAAAIVPTVADLYGAGVAFLGRDGEPLAWAGDDEESLRRLLEHLDEADRDGRVRVAEVQGYRLVVRTSPYAPVFGEVEEDLLEQFRLQLSLALQRVELFAAHDAAREELQRSYDDQQAMLIGLAHDLRSPTVTIAAYGALLDDARDLDDARAMAADIRVSADYLDRLVDGISELSRIGRRDGTPEPVSLAEVVVGTAARLKAAHPLLSVEVDGALPVVCVDRLRIEQVVDNLLSNACRHGGRADPTVTIRSEPVDGGVRIVVADDGRGIPESEHEVVFGLFRRGSTSDQAGSGIGLGLVRRIVDSLGGQIRLVPSSAGACFELDLPDAVVIEDLPPQDPPRDDRAAANRSARPV